jgi:pimeloyl-ACP methyl ester carboxylesterase
MQKKSSVLEWIAVGIVLVLLLGVGGFIASVLLLGGRAQTSAAHSQPASTQAAPTQHAAVPTPPASATPLATPTGPPQPTTTPLPAYDPVFESADCPMHVPPGANVECGYLVVPEDRSHADSPLIRLAVAIIRSTSPTPQPDPIFYLEGGPGGVAMNSLDIWIEQGFNAQRDMIVLAQRGTAYAEPSLNCPEMGDWTRRYMGSAEATMRSQLLICRRRLVDEGVSLSMYNSAANAADVNDLRRVLGYNQVNLLGISYGTRLALTTMRDFPQHIRSVVLDSTYPPHVDSFAEHAANTVRAFDALFAGCAADPACNAAYPNLDQTFYRLINDLNEQPAMVEFVDFTSGETVTMPVYGDDLIDLFFLLMYDTEAIRYLPQIISDIDQGYYDLLTMLLQLEFEMYGPGGYDIGDGFSEGMFYSVQCYEEMPFANDDRIDSALADHPNLRQYFADRFELDETLCRIWRVDEADPLENEPVQSPISTLILAGEYDPVTPPRWGRQAAETLSNNFFYEFPGTGHGVSILGGCPTSITLAFLDNPTSAPDTSCMAGLGGPDFVLPFVEPGVALEPVEHGGNLRSAPQLGDGTVLGQVCPGDRVVVLEEQQSGGVLWKRVRVETTSIDCHPQRVPVGTEGWLSDVLLNWPDA